MTMTDSDYRATAQDIRHAAYLLRKRISAAEVDGLNVHIGQSIGLWLNGLCDADQLSFSFTKTY